MMARDDGCMADLILSLIMMFLLPYVVIGLIVGWAVAATYPQFFLAAAIGDKVGSKCR